MSMICPRCAGTGQIDGPQTLGDRLVAIREARKLSQAEVGAATGLSHATLWRMEKAANINGGSIETLIKLADFYRVSLDELLVRTALAGREDSHASTEGKDG